MAPSPGDPPVRRRTTLNDIARKAGISAGTVSAILSGKTRERRISDELAERVRLIARELDYAPNLLVHSIQGGRTHMLSFFNGFRNRDRQDFYMDALTTGVERAAGAYGYDIAVYCDFRRSVEDTYQHLNGGRSDGLILFTPQVNDPLLPSLRMSRLPVVVLNGRDDDGVLSSVREDFEGGLAVVADTLAGLGHRRVAMLTASPNFNPDAAMRVTSLRKHLGRHGIVVPDRWVVEAPYAGEPPPSAAIDFLLSEPSPPTAVFCWNDRVGYMALQHCEYLGIAVPDRLSIVGYDGMRWPVGTGHVLASVVVDLDAMGESAVEVLDGLVVRSHESPIIRTLSVDFRPGTTLGPVQHGE